MNKQIIWLSKFNQSFYLKELTKLRPASRHSPILFSFPNPHLHPAARPIVKFRRLDHSIQRYVEPSQWSAAAGRVKGSNNLARQVNLYLDTLNSKVLRLEREMVLDGITVNFANFREKWLGLTEWPRMLLEIFQQHNDQLTALVKAGKDFSPATLDRCN